LGDSTWRVAVLRLDGCPPRRQAARRGRDSGAAAASGAYPVGNPDPFGDRGGSRCGR